MKILSTHVLIRGLEGLFSILLIAMVFSGFTDNQPQRSESFNFLMSMGVLGLILSSFRVYYVEILKWKWPYVKFQLCLDFVLTALALAASISGIGSDPLEQCDERPRFVDPLLYNCDLLYAAIIFGFFLVVTYLVSCFFSFKKYLEDSRSGMENSWGFPNGYEAYIRICVIVVSILVLGFSANFGELFVSRSVPAKDFLISASTLSLFTNFVILCLLDLPKNGPSVKPLHPFLMGLIYFFLFGLSFSASTYTSASRLIDLCTGNDLDSINCTSIYLAIVFGYILSVVQAIQFFLYFRECHIKGPSGMPKYMGGDLDVIEPPIFYVRMVIALFSLIAFITGLAFIESKNIIGILNRVIYVIASGYISFMLSIFVGTYVNLLDKTFPHAILPVLLELSLFLLNFVAGILGATDPICDSNGQCSTYKAAFAFNFLTGFLHLGLFIWLVKGYKTMENNALPNTSSFFIRMSQILLSLIMFATAAGTRESFSSNERELIIGVGVSAFIVTCIWTYCFHLMNHPMPSSVVENVMDGLICSMCFITGIATAASDAAKRCRDGNSLPGCDAYVTSIVFTWITFALYAAYLALRFVNRTKGNEYITQNSP